MHNVSEPSSVKKQNRPGEIGARAVLRSIGLFFDGTGYVGCKEPSYCTALAEERKVELSPKSWLHRKFDLNAI
jgi:hypothetical protein